MIIEGSLRGELLALRRDVDDLKSALLGRGGTLINATPEDWKGNGCEEDARAIAAQLAHGDVISVFATCDRLWVTVGTGDRA